MRPAATLIASIVVCLSGCNAAEDKEALVARCQISTEGKSASVSLCMTANGHEPVYNDFCNQLRAADAHLALCFEYRGFVYRLKRFAGIA